MRPKPPDSSAAPFLRNLYRLLREANYDAATLNELFPDTTLTGRDVARVPAYRLSVRESDKQAHRLSRFLLLREPLGKEHWHREFGESLVRQGVECGVFTEGANYYEANFDIQPCLDNFVLTDPKFRHAAEGDALGVYYLGSDSYGLVNNVPRGPAKRALDIFTGSGVHAILAAGHCREVVGVDINPRAVEISRANAAFNGVSERCRFLQSDLFTAVEGQTFDLITANPPFVPTPDRTLALYRGGGEGGELLTGRLLKRLHEFLEPGGLMAMVTNYPVFRGVDILKHHQEMLGEPEQFGIALLHNYLFPREMYVQMHMERTGTMEGDQREFQRWIDSYEKQNIIGIGFGLLYFTRLAGGRPWLAHKEAENLVTASLSFEVDAWLEGLRQFAEGTSHERSLSFHPLARLFVDQQAGEGHLQWHESSWPRIRLSAPETRKASEFMEAGKFRWSETDARVLAKIGREGMLVTQ